MKEKTDSFFRITHSFFHRARYMNTMRTVYALFFSFMLLNLIKNSILVFLLAILAHMQGSL